MINKNITKSLAIARATSRDLPAIKRLAKADGLLTDDLKAGEFLAAKEKGRIVGFGRLKKYPTLWELGCLGVRADKRGRGIGEALVAKLIDSSPSEVYVTTIIPRYFRKFGFRTVAKCPSDLVRKAAYCAGCRPANCRVMVKRKRHA